MKTSAIAIAVIMTAALATWPNSARAITLASNGRTDYRIIMPQGVDSSTWAAALDMAELLAEATGAVFPVCFDLTPAQGGEIIIGADNARLRGLDPAARELDLAPEAYLIRTVGPHILIIGGSGRGDINGIYGFLQDYVGCRWLTPGCQHVPRRAHLTLPDIDERQTPAFRYRSTCSPMQWDANWCVRNRLNESRAWSGGPRPAAIMQLHADPRTASMANSWNPHALQDVPEEVYQEHPEWRAEIDGERRYIADPVHRAYCMTDNAFAAWVAQWTIARLRREPETTFVSITNGDNATVCVCADCRASIAELGGSGVYMNFANAVAADIAEEFPHVGVVVLAYFHTFAPNPVAAHPNVRVVWAPIRADYAHAIDAGEFNQAQDFIGQLAHWRRHTGQLGVWYYQFNLDSMTPRPALAATQRSLQVFRDLGLDQAYIEMFFNCCRKDTLDTDGDKSLPAYAMVTDYYTRQGDYGSIIFPYGFEHLRGYIYARLLWDADFDIAAGVAEFCDIYYGPAGAEIGKIAWAAEQLDNYDASRNRGNRLHEYPGLHMDLSFAPRLRYEMLAEFNAGMERAAARVAHDETFRRRAAMARMGIDLALVAHEETDPAKRRAALERFAAQAETIQLAPEIRLSGVGSMNLAQLRDHVAGVIGD